jgi:hypothetical protein
VNPFDERWNYVPFSKNERNKLDYLRLTEEDRRNTVINYIQDSSGCTAEDIVNNQKLIGRVKIFRILKELKKEEIITAQVSLKDKRKSLLFINQKNYLVSVPMELDEIDRLLNPIFSKCIERLSAIAPDDKWRDPKGRYHGRDDYNYAVISLLIPIEIIINMIIQIYNRKAFDWSEQIRDRESLDRLHMNCFLRIHGFQRRFNDMVDKTLKKNPELRENSLEVLFTFPPGTFQESVGYIMEYGMLKVSKSLLKYLAKISGNDSQLLHNKKRKKFDILEIK